MTIKQLDYLKQEFNNKRGMCSVCLTEKGINLCFYLYYHIDRVSIYYNCAKCLELDKKQLKKICKIVKASLKEEFYLKIC